MIVIGAVDEGHSPAEGGGDVDIKPRFPRRSLLGSFPPPSSTFYCVLLQHVDAQEHAERARPAVTFPWARAHAHASNALVQASMCRHARKCSEARAVLPGAGGA